VIYLLLNISNSSFSWFYGLNCRLIHATAMGITCIITMKNGAKRILASHSFIGEINFLRRKHLLIHSLGLVVSDWQYAVDVGCFHCEYRGTCFCFTLKHLKIPLVFIVFHTFHEKRDCLGAQFHWLDEMGNFDYVSNFLFWPREACHVEWNFKWNDEEVKVVFFHWNFLICLILQVGSGKWEKSWSWTVPEIEAPEAMHKVSRTCMCTYLLDL